MRLRYPLAWHSTCCTTIPGNKAFWTYYARGSRQNMATFGGKRAWRTPGTYLYRLTREPFDTRQLQNGIYRLVVTATDIRGNSSSLAQVFIVRNELGGVDARLSLPNRRRARASSLPSRPRTGSSAGCRSRRSRPWPPVHPVKDPVGLMVTSGGWAYCEQMRPVTPWNQTQSGLGWLTDSTATSDRGCGRSVALDWGNPLYLASLAQIVAALGIAASVGQLILIGVSYSGFGVATLATHHPELHPDRLIVIDSYFDLGLPPQKPP